jgi:hypothetical protein
MECRLDFGGRRIQEQQTGGVCPNAKENGVDTKVRDCKNYGLVTILREKAIGGNSLWQGSRQ